MRWRLTFTLLFLAVAARAAFGFVLQTDRTPLAGIVSLHWSANQVRNGISFWVDAQSFPFSEGDVLRIVRDSFAAWEGVETSLVTFRDRGTGRFTVSERDGRNVVLYDADGSEFGPRGAGVLAFTRVKWRTTG